MCMRWLPRSRESHLHQDETMTAGHGELGDSSRSYMLPARNCRVNLGIRQLGIGLQRCFSEVIPQIQCGSI